MESAIGINMCRCCASEGSYKDLNTKFTWMGETEIYADMLQYCFDINLEKEESDNGGICEVCITQLRHASNFKKQVLITEEKFKKRLQEKLFSRDAIKLEMNEVSIDSDNDNRVMDDFSEPEYDIPIKEEIEVEVKPKKRSAKASTSTTSRVKKPKNEEGEPSNKRDHIEIARKTRELTVSRRIKSAIPEVVIDKHNVPADWTVTIKTNTVLPSQAKPVTKIKSNTAKPGTIKSSTANPVTIKSSTANPFTIKSSTANPVTIKSSTGNPVTIKSNSSKPGTFKSIKAKPLTINLDTPIPISNTTRLGTFKRIKAKPVTINLDTAIPISNTTVPIKKVEKRNPNVIMKSCETILNKELMNKHLENVRAILLNTNATPVRQQISLNYYCNFCIFSCPNIHKLKEHILRDHVDFQIQNFMSGVSLRNYTCKLDITDFKCKLCEYYALTLEEMMDHLIEHGVVIHKDINNHILSFRVENDKFICPNCLKRYNTLKNVTEHMRVHYKNYVCETCNATFIKKRNLQNHLPTHRFGKFTCSYCSKVFDTRRKWLVHEKFVHTDAKNRVKCALCPERFSGQVSKIEHMVKVHGLQRKTFSCAACEREFKNCSVLSCHMRKYHLMEKTHECNFCESRFFAKKDLVFHMLKHTGEKRFQCDLCLKSYARKSTLRGHIRIHANDRRFKCSHCGMTFVQKCSMKSHLLTKHGELIT